MKTSALEGRGGEMPMLFEERLQILAHCVFCGKLRPPGDGPRFMCRACRQLPQWAVFPPAASGRDFEKFHRPLRARKEDVTKS